MVIPRGVRRALNIRAGTELAVARDPDRDELHSEPRPECECDAKQVAALAGCLGTPGRRRTLSDRAIHEAMLRIAGERYERSKRGKPLAAMIALDTKRTGAPPASSVALPLSGGQRRSFSTLRGRTAVAAPCFSNSTWALQWAGKSRAEIAGALRGVLALQRREGAASRCRRPDHRPVSAGHGLRRCVEPRTVCCCRGTGHLRRRLRQARRRFSPPFHPSDFSAGAPGKHSGTQITRKHGVTCHASLLRSNAPPPDTLCHRR